MNGQTVECYTTFKRTEFWGCPGGSVVKNPSANAGDTGSIESRKIPHSKEELGPWATTIELGSCSYWAYVPQQLKPMHSRACAPQLEKPLQWEACVQLSEQKQRSPYSLQLEQYSEHLKKNIQRLKIKTWLLLAPFSPFWAIPHSWSYR